MVSAALLVEDSDRKRNPVNELKRRNEKTTLVVHFPGEVFPDVLPLPSTSWENPTGQSFTSIWRSYTAAF